MILYDVIFSSVLAMLGMVWGIDAAASMNMITNKIYFLHAHDVDLKYVLKFLGYFCHRIFEPYGVKSEFNFFVMFTYDFFDFVYLQLRVPSP